MDSLNYVCIATTGSVDSGKSTISGHMTAYKRDILDIYDSKEYPLLNHISKHPHERTRGQTSDIGYKSVEIDGKEIVLVDLAGHHKYLKTTTKGIVSLEPDYAVLMVGGNRGFLEMTYEHIMILQKMDVPFIINFTKEDIAPSGIYNSFMKEIKTGGSFKKKSAIIINEPLKEELKKDIIKNNEIVKKIVYYKNGLLKLKQNTYNEKKILVLKNEYSKYTHKEFDTSLSLYNGIVLLIELLEQHIKNNPTIQYLVSMHFKVKYILKNKIDNILIKNSIKITENILRFAANYLKSYKLLNKQFLSRHFIDDCFRLSRLTNNNDFKLLTDRKTIDGLDFKTLRLSFEKSKKDLCKEKNKLIIYNRFFKYFDELEKNILLDIDENDKICIMDILDKIIEDTKIDDKYISSINNYIDSNAPIDKELVSLECACEINNIIQDYGRNKEVQNLPVTIDKIKEFMIDNKRFPVLATSCRTGYYLETYKVILSQLEKKKINWKDTDNSIFSVESVIHLNSSKKTLPFKGFIVSGKTKGMPFCVNDNVLLGPHEGVMVKALIKSIHNNNKKDSQELKNTERGCLGLSITDDRYKNFTYNNAREGMVVIKKDYPNINNHICWEFTCNVEISSKSKITIKNGTQPVIYLGNIRQTVQFILPDNKIIKSGENTKNYKVKETDIVLRFIKNAEFIPFDKTGREKTIFLLSEGVTKGRGVVTSILPAIKDSKNYRIEPKKKSQKNKELISD